MMRGAVLVVMFAIWVGAIFSFAAWRSRYLRRKNGGRKIVQGDWTVRLFVSASSLIALALVVILMTHQDSLT